MVRMDTSTGKAKSSAYLTFRTLAEGSPGWIQKAKPGLWILRGVAAGIESEIPEILRGLLDEVR